MTYEDDMPEHLDTNEAAELLGVPARAIEDATQGDAA